MVGALTLLGLTILAVAVLTIPGWLLLRPWLPSYLAWGISPATTLIVMSVCALAFPQVSRHWNWIIVGGLLLAMIAASELLSILSNRDFGKKASLRRNRMRASATRFSRADHIGILLGAVCAYLPAAIAIGRANQPAQAWDAAFHQAAIETFKTTHDVSSIGSLELLMGKAGQYYPTGAEAFAALIPGNPIAVYNATSIAFLILLPLIMATIVKTLVPKARYAVGITAFIAGGIKSFTAITTLVAVLCYSAGLLAAGASLALILYIVRNRHYAIVPLTAVFILGTAVVHGSAAFTLLVAGFPVVVYGWVDLCRNVLPSRWKIFGWILGSLTIVALPLVGWVARQQLATVFYYRRPSLSAAAGLSEWPLDISSVAASGVGLWGSVFVAVLGLVGYYVWITGRTRVDSVIGICLGISLITSVVLLVAAMGPENFLRSLTAPWYRQGARVAVLCWMLTLIGVAIALRFAERRWDAQKSAEICWRSIRSEGPIWLIVLIVLAVLTPFTQSVARYDVVAREYQPARIRWGTMMSTAQIELIERAASDKEINSSLDNRTVLADPVLGGTLFYTVVGMNTPLRQLNAPLPAKYQPLLKTLQTDPTPAAVCANLKDIGFIYIVDNDPKRDAQFAEGLKPSKLNPLLQKIPRSILKPVLESGDSAALYEVNCPAHISH